jgi:MOSC domain-containing protein YiiM
MQGTIVQISISRGGLPKLAVPKCFVTPFGMEGDRQAHPSVHGGARKAVLLVAQEGIDELRREGYPLYPGALGENLTTHGLDFRNLRTGDRLRAGSALLEITQPRIPCTALDIYGKTLKHRISDRSVRALDACSPRWGLSGLYASVVETGWIRTGDIIAVVASLA